MEGGSSGAAIKKGYQGSIFESQKFPKGKEFGFYIAAIFDVGVQKKRLFYIEKFILKNRENHGDQNHSAAEHLVITFQLSFFHFYGNPDSFSPN